MRKLSKRQRKAAAARRLAAKRLTETDGTLTLICESAGLEIVAAKGDGDGEPKPPTFKVVAYTGVPLQLGGWLYPVAVDLKGLGVSKRARPALLNRDATAIVGHTTEILKTDKKITAEGVISGGGDAARTVLEAAGNGFPWRMSIGARAQKLVYIEPGKEAQVNGRTVSGPAYIARKATLGEISFVALAADDNTSARIAASAGKIRVTDMGFEQWLRAKGFDPDDVTDEQRASLQAAYDAESAEKVEVKRGQAEAGDAPPAEVDVAAVAKEATEQTIKAERERVGAIEAACKGFDGDTTVDELRAKAIAGELELSDLQTKLIDHVRASRPAAPSIHAHDAPETNTEMIEAALCAGLRLPEAEQGFSEQTLEAAHKQYRDRIGLQEILLIAAAANGYRGRSRVTDGNLREILSLAFPPAHVRAAGGFSTLDLPNVLSNTANKVLVASFNSTEQVWREICSFRDVSDFKAVTGVRLTGDTIFAEVGADGELTHATVGEATYSNQAKTYGKMQAITRKTIIDDDLGALKVVPTRLGRGAGLRVNLTFWTTFLNDSAFFKSANSNYASGAGTALSSTSLGTANQGFLDQTDDDGYPVDIEPTILLVPTAKKITANELMTSGQVQSKGSTDVTKQPTDNIWRSAFDPKCSRYLSNTSISGYSATAWYLLANPAAVACIEVALLNGKAEPTIESADADFNVLGVQFRGFWDFGVTLQEYRAGYKMAGA